MKCPHCYREIAFAKVCPHCGRSISYDGNTEIYEHAIEDKVTLHDIFGDVMRKHSHKELVSSLLREPGDGAGMLSAWRRPWMFARLFAFLLTFSLLLFALMPSISFAQDMFVLFGCMVVPLSLMTFIWEMDIHSNVSIFDLIVLLFFGGIAAILTALQLFAHFRNSAPPFAAFIEEPAKLLICLLFMHIKKRRYYALDGLAIGAAVAAGFAFMESIGYCYREPLMQIGRSVVYVGPDTPLVFLRGVMALFSHILYTAPFVGMLCYIMGGRPFRRTDLMDRRFLMIFACGVACHYVHNSAFEIFVLIETPYLYLSAKHVLEFLFIWSVLLLIMRMGIRQALQVCGASAEQPRPQEQAKPEVLFELRCTHGQYAGRSIRLRSTRPLVLGRGEESQIRFSAATVSGTHCRIRAVPGGLEVCDLQSRNGTYINGIPLHPGQPVIMHRGDTLGLDRGREHFILQ